MGVDATELIALAHRLRRSTTSREVLEYIDGSLQLITNKLIVPGPAEQSAPCPICEARRRAKADRMRRYRAKAKP